MKPTKVIKNIRQNALDPLLETAEDQVIKPMMAEAANELGGFIGLNRGISTRPREMAAEDLRRAREKEDLEEMDNEEKQNSQKVYSAVKEEYRFQEIKTENDQTPLKSEFLQLQQEVAKLAKASGIETKAHIEATPKKIGILDIKRLIWIVRLLRLRAEESNSAKELVAQRSNAKRTTGMLAWVSGKQMKVHEQGTLHLQG